MNYVKHVFRLTLYSLHSNAAYIGIICSGRLVSFCRIEQRGLIGNL